MYTVDGLYYLDRKPIVFDIDSDSGRIAAMRRPDKPGPLASRDLYIAPGLFDNQVNGYCGVSFIEERLSAERVEAATRELWRSGVTRYLPTLITSELGLLERNFRVLGEAVERNPVLSLSIPGFHLEGPYISPEDGYRGAHLARWVRPPDLSEFLALQRASGDRILQLSLAPELPGALELIRGCRRRGIVVGLAHHHASAAAISASVDAGAAIAVHLGSGLANTIHRHDNVYWPQLAEERLKISMIADGFHLRPEQVAVFFRVKGVEGIVLTSDVINLAGLPAGEYTIEGREVVLSSDGQITYPAEGVLAGAARPLSAGIGNVMRFTGCTLADAVHMASRTPAQLYGLGKHGGIEPGERADLIVFGLEKGEMRVGRTILAGEVVYEEESLASA